MKGKNKFFFTIFYIIISIPLLGQEVCNNCIDDDNDGLIDCYDPECLGKLSCEGFFIRNITSSNIYLCDSTTDSIFSLQEFWQRYQVGIESKTTPIVGDIDNDNIPEVITRLIVGDSTYLSLLNGQTGVPNNILLPYKIASEMAIGDIDNDGLGEIICFSNFGADWALTCLENDGSEKWRNTINVIHPYLPSMAPYPSLADFNADGNPEIYMGNKIYNSLDGSLIVSGIGSIGKFIKGYNGYSFSAAADVLPDSYCDDCSGLELVCGNQIYAVDIANSQLTISSIAPEGLLDGFTSVSDIDGDDSLDVIVNMYQNVYIWNPRTKTQLGTTFSLIVGKGKGVTKQQGGIPNIGNLDNNQEPEIGIATDTFYFAIKYDKENDTLIELWKTKVHDLTGNGTPSSTMFDLDCNNELEIVYRDGDTLYIIEGSTGHILSKQKCKSGTSNERPIVVDVDNDGHAEIICGCENESPGFGLHTFKNTYNSWTATRTVMNQQNYFATHINDDLTIACSQQNHAMTLPVINSYLNQMPFINYDNNKMCYDLLLLPDPNIIIDSIVYRTCAWDSSFVYVTICNNKFGDIQSGIPVSVYKNDPINGFSYLKTEYLSDKIPGLNCSGMKISVYDDSSILYVVVNDTGTDFPSIPHILFEECNVLNNTDSIFFDPINDLIYPELALGGKDTSICYNEILHLDAGPLGQSYLWSTSDTTQILIVKDTGIYWVTIYIDSCSYTDSIYVNSYICNKNAFFTPNVFSPDGDGINDYFQIAYEEDIANILEVRIYDRLGTLLFQTSSGTAWDGTFNGKSLSSDIYLYTIDIKLPDNTYTTIAGNISLIR